MLSCFFNFKDNIIIFPWLLLQSESIHSPSRSHPTVKTKKFVSLHLTFTDSDMTLSRVHSFWCIAKSQPTEKHLLNVNWASRGGGTFFSFLTWFKTYFSLDIPPLIHILNHSIRSTPSRPHISFWSAVVSIDKNVWQKRVRHVGSGMQVMDHSSVHPGWGEIFEVAWFWMEVPSPHFHLRRVLYLHREICRKNHSLFVS